MNKKTTKPSEQTDKFLKEKLENQRKVKERLVKLDLTRLSILNKAQKVMLDRGDSKNTRNDDTQLKYDANKNCRSVESNIKSNKVTVASNVGNKTGALTKKTELQKVISNNRSCTTEPKASMNCKPMDRKLAEEKKNLEKAPQCQKVLGKNDPTGKEKLVDGDKKKTKIKEVITIPYLPADDSATQISERDSSEQTRPSTKSIMSKDGPKAPKTVSFKDQSERSSFSNNTEKRTVRKSSWANVKTKVVCSKTRVQATCKTTGRRNAKCHSPAHDKYNINEFPPTEVVKWEPSCLTSETQPYYEAWIDTTLTAFSKCSEEEKLLLEKDLIEAFQYLKRPVSPELFYENFNDEQYTGRIKVRRPRR
ncbi:uncharacterized protein DDB_G0286299-like [Battus philenor]|uniref:uncharacterized protein DDB_G0286299-like n=1 Tax=Battus philenor TaxID=42288 RepID=UPI0035CF14E8